MKKSLNKQIKNFVKSDGFRRIFTKMYLSYEDEADNNPTQFAWASSDAIAFLRKRFNCSNRRLGLAFGDKPIGWVLFEMM